MKILKCFLPGTGTHNPDFLKKIYIDVSSELHEVVVRWCPNCGAVVIDTDYDSRTNPGNIMPMRFPTYGL